MRRRGKRGKITARKPSKKRRQRFLAETTAWLKKNMHGHPRFQQRKLGAKLRSAIGKRAQTLARGMVNCGVWLFLGRPDRRKSGDPAQGASG